MLYLAKVGVVGSNPIARSKSFNALGDQGGRREIRLSAECPCNLFPARSGQVAILGDGQGDSSDSPPILSNNRTSSKTGVREQSGNPATPSGLQDHGKHPAHPSNRLIVQLNASWRVIDDPLQWILQRRKGNPRKKNSGWRSRSFCRTREGLLCCIREYCCSPDQGQSRCIREYHGVDDAALQQICALPLASRLGPPQ